MDARRKLLQRGLSRLYVVLVGLWLLYCYLWVPLEVMDANSKGAAARGTPFDARPWVTQYVDIVFGDPPAWFHPLIVVGIPLLGYVLLRLLMAVIYWIKDGFQNENT